MSEMELRKTKTFK